MTTAALNLAELGRRIAAAGWVPRHGQAVRDHTTSAQWRRVIGKWNCEVVAPWSGSWEIDVRVALLDSEDPAYDSPPWAALRRAIADGPDLADEVTALSLLADLPDVSIRTVQTGLGMYWAAFGVQVLFNDAACLSRTEAIAHAWLAVHEMRKPSPSDDVDSPVWTDAMQLLQEKLAEPKP